jgi:carnosine N-methyltransferase
VQEVYARPEYQGTFDAVVTCFFIDTAHNIIGYLEVIHGVLKPGGIWIHLGPLLWHWADGSWDDLSIELSLADVQQVAQLLGFELVQQQSVDAAYIGEVDSSTGASLPRLGCTVQACCGDAWLSAA